MGLPVKQDAGRVSSVDGGIEGGTCIEAEDQKC